MMPLDLSNLRNSVQSLSDLLAVAENNARMGQFSEIERDGIRAGVIQNFEITYELSWKLIVRWINANVGLGIADGVTRRQLFRLAAESLLIHDVDEWMVYHDARNATSHIYDEEWAVRVYQAAKEFAHDARRLLGELEARNE